MVKRWICKFKVALTLIHCSKNMWTGYSLWETERHPCVHVDMKVLDRCLLNGGPWAHLWGAVGFWLVTNWSDFKGTCVCQLRVWWDISRCVWAHGSSTVLKLSTNQGGTIKMRPKDSQACRWRSSKCSEPPAMIWPLPVYSRVALLLLLFSSIILLNKTRWIEKQLRKWSQSRSSYLWSPTTQAGQRLKPSLPCLVSSGPRTPLPLFFPHRTLWPLASQVRWHRLSRT